MKQNLELLFEWNGWVWLWLNLTWHNVGLRTLIFPETCKAQHHLTLTPHCRQPDSTGLWSSTWSSADVVFLPWQSNTKQLWADSEARMLIFYFGFPKRLLSWPEGRRASVVWHWHWLNRTLQRRRRCLRNGRWQPCSLGQALSQRFDVAYLMLAAAHDVVGTLPVTC